MWTSEPFAAVAMDIAIWDHMVGASEVSLTPGHKAASVTQYAALVSICYSTSMAACKLALTSHRSLQRQSGVLVSFQVKHINLLLDNTADGKRYIAYTGHLTPQMNTNGLLWSAVSLLQLSHVNGSTGMCK